MPPDHDELCGIEPCRSDWIDSLRINLDRVIVVRKIILFGSRARRNHTTWSDYDICVVSDDFEGKTVWERMDIVLSAWDGERGLEPVCFTQAEFDARGLSWQKALSEGVVLFTGE